MKPWICSDRSSRPASHQTFKIRGNSPPYLEIGRKWSERCRISPITVKRLQYVSSCENSEHKFEHVSNRNGWAYWVGGWEKVPKSPITIASKNKNSMYRKYLWRWCRNYTVPQWFRRWEKGLSANPLDSLPPSPENTMGPPLSSICSDNGGSTESLRGLPYRFLSTMAPYTRTSVVALAPCLGSFQPWAWVFLLIQDFPSSKNMSSLKRKRD